MDKSEIKAFIAKRVAKELKDGDVVNLGIGLPTLVPAYLPEGVHVILQSENGIIGTGAKPTAEEADPHFKIDAGGSPAQDQLRKILCAALFALWFELRIVLCVVPDENLFYLTAAVRAVVGLEEFP